MPPPEASPGAQVGLAGEPSPSSRLDPGDAGAPCAQRSRLLPWRWGLGQQQAFPFPAEVTGMQGKAGTSRTKERGCWPGLALPAPGNEPRAKLLV